MPVKLTPLFLLTATLYAQTPAPTQPTGAVATGAVFFSIGGGFDAYKSPSTEGLFSLGIQIGNTPFYSISTLAVQPGLVTARSGFGYAAKQFGWGKRKPFFLVLLADAGATTGSTTSTMVTPTTTSTTGDAVLLRALDVGVGSFDHKFKKPPIA